MTSVPVKLTESNRQSAYLGSLEKDGLAGYLIPDEIGQFDSRFIITYM